MRTPPVTWASLGMTKRAHAQAEHARVLSCQVEVIGLVDRLARGDGQKGA